MSRHKNRLSKRPARQSADPSTRNSESPQPDDMTASVNPVEQTAPPFSTWPQQSDDEPETGDETEAERDEPVEDDVQPEPAIFTASDVAEILARVTPPPRNAPAQPRQARRKKQGRFAVTSEEWRVLLQRRRNPEAGNKRTLFLLGIILTPITLAGALLGYVRGYNRFMWPYEEYPALAPLKPVVRVAMILGAILLWVVLYLLYVLLYQVIGQGETEFLYFFGPYVIANLILTLVTWFVFRRWQGGVQNTLIESNKFGSARFARPDELKPYQGTPGLYIGNGDPKQGGYTFSGKGHILTCAGTRGGKGTNLIIPNLLGLGGYQGSWVVIDPKGENAAITARYQRETGQDVVVLNPWGLLADQLGAGQSYNPLDILSDRLNVNLVDDVQMVAEMIVPIDKNESDKFFTDNARAIVAGLILHLVTIQPLSEPEKQEFKQAKVNFKPPEDAPRATLKTLWEWVRYAEDKWEKLLEDMAVNDFPRVGDVVKQAGLEVMKLMSAGDKTWGNIVAVILQSTDFIKSPALQKSLESGFDSKRLSEGKTSVYVIIPADKLQSHARWLRLVVTTTMRAVVRRQGKRVCFMLDEFSALGYLPEIETALSTYAGFEITVWPILQSLIQLKAHYHTTWETFVGNSTIRQFFSVNDNFTADYVSKAIGNTSHVIVNRSGGMIDDARANARALVTPDELRRESGRSIFLFSGENPVTYFRKMPYYEMPQVMQNADNNPYY